MLALVLLALVGCASSLRRADRLYDAGAYAEAVTAYEAVLSDDAAERALDRVLSRLAVLYAWPESPVHDEDRARALLREVTRRFASGPLAAQAARVLASEATETLLREETERLRQEAGRLGKEAEQLGREAERLRREIAACRDQLEKLKAIDAGGTP